MRPKLYEYRFSNGTNSLAIHYPDGYLEFFPVEPALYGEWEWEESGFSKQFGPFVNRGLPEQYFVFIDEL